MGLAIDVCECAYTIVVPYDTLFSISCKPSSNPKSRDEIAEFENMHLCFQVRLSESVVVVNYAPDGLCLFGERR